MTLEKLKNWKRMWAGEARNGLYCYALRQQQMQQIHCWLAALYEEYCCAFNMDKVNASQM